MSAASQRGREDGREAGFAQLFLLLVIGAMSGVFLLAVDGLVPAQGDHQSAATENVATVRLAAADAFRRAGSFPANLDALAAAVGLDATGTWRRDPWALGGDLSYAIAGTTLTIRSAGADRVANNADDVVGLVYGEEAGRRRQRDRLRLIRALLLRSSYRLKAGMTPAEQANMRSWSRDWVQARRDYLDSDPPTRAVLQARMNADAASIAALCTARGCDPLPASVTGASGLMAGLGLPDTIAVDGFGRTFALDAAVGVVSVGGDGSGGTGDDM